MDAAELGARIKQYRERALMSGGDLAHRIGIDASAVSRIENGTRAVKTHELSAIAAALNVSPLAILEKDSLLARLPVAPRATTGARLDSDGYHFLITLAELHEVLAECGFPAFPELDGVPPTRSLPWKEAAETLAGWASDVLAVSATGSERFDALVEAIELKLKVDVVVKPLSDDDFMGAALTADEFPLILVNADLDEPRALFTLAHELAHVLGKGGEPLAIDQDLRSKDAKERFANAFAAAYLMPPGRVHDLLREYGRNSTALGRMMVEFGVSYESLVYRLQNLHIVDNDGRRTLEEYGWRGILQGTTDEYITAGLVGRIGSKPEIQIPRWLTIRALESFRAGRVSIGPFAGLTGLDPDLLLDEIERSQELAKTINEEGSLAPPPGYAPDDDELFSGNPA